MIYQQGNISVDQHFARFGSKSYAIDKINSVDVKVEEKSGCVWIALAVFAGLLGLNALGSLASASGPSFSEWVTFLVFAGIAYAFYRARPTPIYHLMLATSSGEVQATNAGDREVILELRQAIEHAMTKSQ